MEKGRTVPITKHEIITDQISIFKTITGEGVRAAPLILIELFWSWYVQAHSFSTSCYIWCNFTESSKANVSPGRKLWNLVKVPSKEHINPPQFLNPLTSCGGRDSPEIIECHKLSKSSKTCFKRYGLLHWLPLKDPWIPPFTGNNLTKLVQITALLPQSGDN